MLRTLEIEAAASIHAERPIAAFRPGDVLSVALKVPENRRRTSQFTGLCIARK